MRDGATSRDGDVILLGDGMDLIGKVTLHGTVRVDGRLKGEIHAFGTLQVSERGIVEGIVHAKTLINSGLVKGTVTVTEKVHLVKPGVLIGEVHTPCFTIEEGACFEGRSDMGESPLQERGNEQAVDMGKTDSWLSDSREIQHEHTGPQGGSSLC